MTDQAAAFQKQAELAGGQAPRLRAVAVPGRIEPPPFPGAPHDDEAGAVPIEDPRLAAVAGDEQKHVAIQRVAAERGLGRGVEPVEAFAHADGLGTGPDPHLTGAANHESALSNAAAVSTASPSMR